MIKILIGGSPCTFWSIAQKNNRETVAEGLGWELFENFLIAKEKFKPDLFLYENNKSAAKPIKDQISRELGVDLMYINSALVSAQNRQRFYAFNWTVEQPEDRGILLRDILESGEAWREKAYTIDSNYWKTAGQAMERQSGRRKMVAEPVGVGYRNRREDDGKLYRRFETHGEAKANALTTVQTDSMVAEPIQTDPRGKSRPIQASYGKYAASDSFKETNPRTGVAIRIGTIENESANPDHDSQQYRVYSPNGKSVTLCGNGGGLGAKTGLYATPVALNTTAEGKAQCVRATCYKDGIRNLVGNDVDKRTCVAIPLENDPEIASAELVPYVHRKIGDIVEKYGYLPEVFNPYNTSEITDKSPTLTASMSRQTSSASIFFVLTADGKEQPVYCVHNGLITIKDKQYPIKLADGFYIIRKLTPVECERLQTMPDGYTAAVSNTQRYKGLGNGWTAEVIIHILQGALWNIPRDEEIVVLSMYDGIGTGRYCLDKMGFTNVTYYAYEIDKPAMKVATSNFPDIIQLGDAFDLRRDDWSLPIKPDVRPDETLETECRTPQPNPEEMDAETETELHDDIFTIKARRCKRCGGILTNKQAVEDGYGHVCKMKTIEEKNAQRPIDGQISLLDFAERRLANT